MWEKENLEIPYFYLIVYWREKKNENRVTRERETRPEFEVS